MTPGRRDALILGGVALGAAAIGGVVGALALQSGSGTAALLGSRFADLSGNPRRLLEWRGRPLLVNFWATWCAPCREEMPLLDAAQQQYAAQGLQVVGIAIDNAANVGKFTETVKVGYPSWLADAGALQLMRDLGNPGGGLPFTVLIDRRGRLASRKLGAYTAAELHAALGTLLQ